MAAQSINLKKAEKQLTDLPAIIEAATKL